MEASSLRILVLTTQVPFVRGGAEIHAENLKCALQAAGHEAEIVAIPFKWYPAERILDHMLSCRLLDLTESNGTPIDLVIGLKFPAYLIPHPRKVLWILHQFRTAYDLWDSPLGDIINHPLGKQIRHAINLADNKLIPEASAIFANSQNVANRLLKYNSIKATPLYHPPPQATEFYTAPGKDYLFFPSRLSPTKRQALAIEALAATQEKVKIIFAGAPDFPPFVNELKNLATRLNVEKYIVWRGLISEDEKRELYANSLGVVYPPVDEDYGYVTLEAMLSAKPVITCSDSGGTLEFVKHFETGLIAAPTAQSLAEMFDELWRNRSHAKIMGENGRKLYKEQDISWQSVVQQILKRT